MEFGVSLKCKVTDGALNFTSQIYTIFLKLNNTGEENNFTILAFQNEFRANIADLQCITYINFCLKHCYVCCMHLLGFRKNGIQQYS